MDRKEWVRDYGSRGLRGNILVRVSYTDDTKEEYWISKFLEISNLPVYNLSLIDKEFLDRKTFKNETELSEADKYLREKYQDNLRVESAYFLIDPETEILKRPTSDKGLHSFYEIKFDSEVNLRELDNTRIISSNIRVSKARFQDFIMDLSFDLAGEAGLFFDRGYSPSLYTKLCYFNTINIYKCLEIISE